MSVVQKNMDAQENLAESQILPVPTSKEFQGLSVDMSSSVWGAWADTDSAESDEDDDDGVLVEIDTPMDSNCQIASLKSKLAAALGLGPKYQQDAKRRVSGTGQCTIEAFGQVALLELFKITDVKAFEYACRKFQEGLEKGQSHTELLDMIVDVQQKRG